MALKDVLHKMKEKIFHKEPQEDIDDNETQDKYLRSLRRQRRLQLEEMEKERLIKTIRLYQKQKMVKELYGIKSNISHKKKAKKYLKNGQGYLTNGAGMLKKGGGLV